MDDPKQSIDCIWSLVLSFALSLLAFSLSENQLVGKGLESPSIYSTKFKCIATIVDVQSIIIIKLNLVCGLFALDVRRTVFFFDLKKPGTKQINSQKRLFLSLKERKTAKKASSLTEQNCLTFKKSLKSNQLKWSSKEEQEAKKRRKRGEKATNKKPNSEKNKKRLSSRERIREENKRANKRRIRDDFVWQIDRIHSGRWCMARELLRGTTQLRLKKFLSPTLMLDNFKLKLSIGQMQSSKFNR